MKRKTIRNMLEKTKKAFKEEIGKSPSLTCDPIPAPVMGIVKIAKALKDDANPLLEKGKKNQFQ